VGGSASDHDTGEFYGEDTGWQYIAILSQYIYPPGGSIQREIDGTTMRTNDIKTHRTARTAKRASIFGLSLFLSLTFSTRVDADAGIVTILEGSGRVLRGPTWFTLALGGRVQESDVVELGTRGQVQIELANGILLNLAGPATLYLASVPSAPQGGGKAAGPTDLLVANGWLKFAAPPPRSVLLHTGLGTMALAEGIVVLSAGAGTDSLFLESGTAQLSEPKRGGTPAANRSAKGGEFWSRSTERPFDSAKGPPPSFLAGMPRQFIDPLPSRAATVSPSRTVLAADRGVNYAEAKPWLSGPYRRLFLKSFRPRLRDSAFRNAVEVDIGSYPEWDRVLHPEKYLPKTDSQKR
jgi:hypothetical protein